MSQITTTHDSYQIAYNEANDLWECRDLQLDAKNLSGLKAKINKTTAQLRRVDNMPAILKSWGGTRKCNILLIDKSGKIWVTKGTGRELARIEDLYFDSPENEEKIAEAASLNEQANDLSQKATSLLATLRPIRRADMPLVEVEGAEA